MTKKVQTRRQFIKQSTATSVLSMGGVLPLFSAKSYSRISGANERITTSIMGVNSRGRALAENFAQQSNCDVTYVCDVDKRAIANCLTSLQERQSFQANGASDFRSTLEDPDLDALVIAAPDHWHAPATLMALQAGKHVYVEKPCSHNPHEGEMLVQAAEQYGKVVQMGNQRRSWPNVVAGIKAVHQGAIGNVYYGKSWYTNNRASIGVGKEVSPPEWLDWDLWQGPAPRRPYKDNIVHYNWHWLWHWGTGEALNNGTHMIDLLRWGMQVDFPIRVSSHGGRFRYRDDWETPDTQVISIDFDNQKTMTWEGRSCNGAPTEGSTVGVIFYGEEGSIMIPGGNAYTHYDLKGKVIKEEKDPRTIDPRNATNPAEHLDALHIHNFFDAIRQGTPLHADIGSGHKSTLLVQLGNIAQNVQRTLQINPEQGRIIADPQAQQLWSRTYEEGWEMKL